MSNSDMVTLTTVNADGMPSTVIGKSLASANTEVAAVKLKKRPSHPDINASADANKFYKDVKNN